MRRRQKPRSSSSECPPQMATTTTTTTIDDLPECLLTQIISFLPIVDAINTSYISSRWRRLWISSPILHLCIHNFTSCFNHHSKSPLEIRMRFMIFASEILLLRRDNISLVHNFQLSFDCRDDRGKKHVNYWLSYAIAFKCKALSLSLSSYGYGSTSAEEDDDIDDDDDHYRFNLSALTFSESSVEELKLQGCKFFPPSGSSITTLKSLYLQNYDFKMDGSNLTELIPLCVNLELLSIDGIGGWHNLYISSLSLRGGESSIEFHAPNLQSVSFEQFYVAKIIQDANSLVEATVLFPLKEPKTFHCWSHIIASFTRVQRLTVDNMWNCYKFDQIDEPEETTGHDEPDTDSDTESIGIKYSGKVFVSQKIFSEDFAFNNLKYLQLLTGYEKRDVLGLGLCLKMCPKLETLVLVNVCKVDNDDDLLEMLKSKPIIMKMPKLRRVRLMKYQGSRNEVHVVGLLKKHKVVLENITAFPAKEKKKPIILWTSSSGYHYATRSSKAIMG